jgi:hypothetical protein
MDDILRDGNGDEIEDDVEMMKRKKINGKYDDL